MDEKIKKLKERRKSIENLSFFLGVVAALFIILSLYLPSEIEMAILDFFYPLHLFCKFVGYSTVAIFLFTLFYGSGLEYSITFMEKE